MRVLVTVASRHGSSAQIAAVIAEVLAECGLDVEVREPDAVTSVAEFDGVIIGSGVYVGRWLEPARALVDRCAEELIARDVWLFSSGPIGDPPKPDVESPDVGLIAGRTGAHGHRTFAGRIDKAHLGLPEKVVVSALRVPTGDFRPWPDIVAWARKIAVDLAGSPAVVAS